MKENITIENDAVCLDWKKGHASSILMQAMMDETIRLRKSHKRKEREMIMQFLLTAHEAIREIDCGTVRQVKD